ncbi:MAG: SurA N-terminal domain-containing protein [Prevotellaceae bacterium]|nr:SurA N-terminal domain-containing protein [Prevotellaceae bacterium]
MAVLQKIRNKGVLLVSIIALALFLFVIGDFLRGGEVLFTQSRQKAGEIAGKNVSIQDYQKFLTQIQFFYEESGQGNQARAEQINDMAWNTFVQQQIIGNECRELGLAVSDEEVAEFLRSGQHQFLQIRDFINPQTGTYDYAYVQQAINASQQLRDYYIFAQEQIRNELLAYKYQSLLQQSFLANPVEAQQAFNDRVNESDIVLVSIPFTTVDDKDVKVEDSDLKAKYEELKPRMLQPVETRELKYIDVAIVASDEDREAAQKDMDENQQKLAAAADSKAIATLVHNASSLLSYSDVLKKKDAFPAFIQARLEGDSTALQVGQTTPVVFDAANNLYYTLRLLEKTTQADSVLFRGITITGKDEKDVAQKADSVVNALKAGTAFAEMAKKYNQPSDSVWISTSQFQQGQLSADDTKLINTLYAMSKGEVKKMKFSTGATVVYELMDKRSDVTKYKLAAIVKDLKYSTETSTKEFNKLNTFLAANNTLAKIEANAAQNGYVVQTAEIYSGNRSINNLEKTNEIVRWLFDDAKKGEVAQQVFRCGSSDQGHLMVVALSDITEPGYIPFDKVKEQLTTMVTNDKKGEKILSDVKGITTLAAAKAVKGAQVDSISHVSFANAAYIPSAPMGEPMVSALAAKTAKGAFGKAVKGNNAVYMLQVTDKRTTAEQFDAAAAATQVARQNTGMALNSAFGDLSRKANVKDLRYKFF